MKKGNIALIGFMGVGKSTVGRMLAERLGRRFVDIDSLIQDSAGMPISKIFETYGETYFRQIEAQTIASATQATDAVIAVGGGAIESAEVRQILKDTCTVVLLTADLSTLVDRTRGNTGRPLLDGFDPEERTARMLSLLHARSEAYTSIYDITVATDRPVCSVVNQIISEIGEPSDQTVCVAVTGANACC